MIELPRSEHGAYLRADLVALNGQHAVRLAVEHRRLVMFGKSVLVDGGRATDFRTRAAAALMSLGGLGVLTGHTALAMQECSAADRGTIHVLVPYRCRARARSGMLVHRGRIFDTDVRQVEGLRVAAPDFALAEVLCRGRRRDGIACADEVLRRIPEHERADLRARVEARIAARPDPRGRQQAWGLLGLATGLPESPPESWLLLAVVDGGFPPPEPQFRITDIDGLVRHRVDFAWPELRILIEYDGFATHEKRAAEDALRDADLRRRGWIVIRAAAADLKDSARIMSELEQAFRRRGVLTAAA